MNKVVGWLIAIAVVIAVGVGLTLAVTYGQTHPITSAHPADTTVKPFFTPGVQPGATICTLFDSQPSAVEQLGKVDEFGEGVWSIVNISAIDLTKVTVPPALQESINEYVADVAAWPNNHAAVDRPQAVAAARAIDAWVAANCQSPAERQSTVVSR